MTAEVDVHEEVSECGGLDHVPTFQNGNAKDDGDVTTYQNGNAKDDCEDDCDVTTHENGNAKDDGDGSYVFVTGNDADAVAQTDLVEVVVTVPVVQSEPHQVIKVESEETPQSKDEVEEATAECDGELPQVDDGKVREAHLDSTQHNAEEAKVEGETKSDLDQNKESPQLTDETPSCPVAQVQLQTPLEVDVHDLPTHHAQHSVSDTVVSLEADQITPEQNGSSEHAESLSPPVVCGDVPVESAHSLTNEIPLQGQVEQNLESASCPVPDIPSETEDVRGPVSDENRQGLPTGHAQENLPEAVVISDQVDANQITPQKNESSEIDETVEGGESLLTAPSNDTIVEPEVENGDSTITEDFPASADDVKTETEVANSDVKSCETANSLPVDCIKVEYEVNSGPADQDTMSICPANDINTKSDVSEGVNECAVSQSIPVHDTGEESRVSDSIENEGVTECAVRQSIPVDDIGEESHVSDSVENEGVTECAVSQSIPVDDTGEESRVSDLVENEGVTACAVSQSIPVDDVGEKSHVSDSVENEGVTECAVSQSIPVDDTGEESCVSDSAENGSRLPTRSGADVKSEPEVDNAPAVTSRDMAGDDGIVAEYQVLNVSDVNSESAPNSIPVVVHVENGEIRFTSGDSDDKTCQEIEGTEGIHREETSTSSPEGSTVDALEGQNVDAEVGKRPFYFLIRVPRYDDENLKEQIKHAQLEVDQKTQSRDAIRVQMQTKRATCKEYGEKFDAAISEERASRDLLKSKRQEIDSVQSVINIVKNAMSVEDIDGRIRNMEHMIEHETLPLKEEKQFIREIKQLKQLREQISSNMGKQDEVQQALDQKDQIEERLKILRKEADSLRENVLKVEAVTQAAKKKYYEESEKLNKFQAQFKAADDIRQEAYTHLHSLRKQLYEKNKYSWKYRDDVKAANDLAVKGDREALQHLCVNQVDGVMELWNNNDEFRKEYIRCNIRSTLRRLKTLDGRSLGPDEEPPVIPYVVNERVAKDDTVRLISTSKREREEQVVPVEADKKDDKPVAKVGEQKTQTAKSKKLAKPAPSRNGLATVSGRDEIQEAIEEEPKRTKEEEELARKAEELARKAGELRREEEAAKLKELLRLEEKAKAKEALERKKRNADKAQARAALRALKEAEQKEKEREKKARKKENRKAGKPEDINVTNEGESAPSSETPVETPKESKTREKPMTMTKRPQKPSQFTKQTKAKSIPLPLRNRSKKRMQSWMWVLLAALVVFALFLLGNSSVSFRFGLRRFFS